MSSITLTYLDNVSGLSYTQVFDAMRIRGFDPVDNNDRFPDLTHEIVDGSLVQQDIGIRRKFSVELGVLQVYADRLFVGNFMRSNTKYVTYTHDGVVETNVRVVSPKNFKTEWLDDVELGRYIICELIEAEIKTSYPASGGIVPANATTYIKRFVEIVGTSGSVEAFETSLGKLATADAPNGSFPTFDLSNTVVNVNVDGTHYQDTTFYLTDIPSTNNGRLQFYVARSDAGQPHSDGKYYADIMITIIPK